MKPLALFLAVCFGLTLQNADAAPYKLIHAFRWGANDGAEPNRQSSLAVSGSVFYGMTFSGGKYTNGVIFKINTDGSGEKLLHTFDGWSILNTKGSNTDGAYPVGTPVLSGSKLYGITQQGGNNGSDPLGFGWGLGTVFSMNTDGTGFQILHNFGSLNDGNTPVGTLVLHGSTLYGMTEQGGSNNYLEGTVFSIQTDGSGYQILYNFNNNGGSPQGSLALAAASVGLSTLYGMTGGAIFRINTDGSGFQVVHNFAGYPGDGATALGSVTISLPYVYGMTSQGGQNNVGTVFKFDLIRGAMQILHSFSMTEGWGPVGDLALSGTMLYGMTPDGVTNYDHIGSLGFGAVFQINTDGSGYQVLHTFEYPIVSDDGSLPFGNPIVVGSDLYGMTFQGGSTLPYGSEDGGTIFELTLSGSSGTGGGTAPTITTTSPLPGGELDVAYRQQLESSGGEAPYTWAVSAGKLPAGLALSTSGLLSGKPTAGATAGITIKVTGHDKLSSSKAFILTIEAPPTLTVTTPKANAKETSPTLTVTGTASSSTVLGGVFLQLNGGAWTRAQTGNDFATWTYPNLPLMADSNILNVYAIDTSGNYSKTNTVKFTYFVTGPLTVKTNGSGTFAPKDNGKEFQIGGSFTITATPAKKFVFTDWTDGLGNVLSSKAALKFVMSSNLTLVANFTAAPKVTTGGSSGYLGYSGSTGGSSPPSGGRPADPTGQTTSNPP
jgi:uncharacterized repeat protein (TIGR03803 family)